jgi:hypothetical protein
MMNRVLRPMTIGYVKLVREQVVVALAEAKEQGMQFTPVFWTGSHLKPVLIKLYLNSNQGSDKG